MCFRIRIGSESRYYFRLEGSLPDENLLLDGVLRETVRILKRAYLHSCSNTTALIQSKLNLIINMIIRNSYSLDQMHPGKLILIVIILFSTVDCLGQINKSLMGEWAGKLMDSSGEFEYKLKLDQEESGVYTGVSTSLNDNFYCESKVMAVKENGRLIVSEIEVLNSNYPNKQELCLLKLELALADSKLTGNFTPLSNISNCLSGIVSLDKIASPRVKSQVINSQRAIKRVIPSTPKFENSTVNEKPATASPILINESPTTRTDTVARIENKVRVIEINEDEVELSILDNMEIDGDMITLINNDNVIFRKVTLTKIPLTYKINNSRTSVHVLKFYAENLGATPPNTGVLIVKTRNSLIKTAFSSDLNQTATIQINLRKVL